MKKKKHFSLDHGVMKVVAKGTTQDFFSLLQRSPRSREIKTIYFVIITL